MICVTLPIPDRNLSLNGREHWRTVAKGQAEQHRYAEVVAKVQASGWPIPVYASEKVSIYIDVERKKGGKRRDTAGLIEAVKGFCDGLNGIVYSDDSQIRMFACRWDAKPTGNGLIHLYIRSLREPQDWPSVAWATEEW